MAETHYEEFSAFTFQGAVDEFNKWLKDGRQHIHIVAIIPMKWMNQLCVWYET